MNTSGKAVSGTFKTKKFGKLVVKIFVPKLDKSGNPK
jgi:hypothetical protein